LGPQLPAQDNFADYMLTQKAESALVIDGTPTNDPIPEIIVPENAAQTLRATYFRPYHSHASLGPSAAVAQYVDGKLTVWSHTQGPYPLRTLLAHVLGLAEQNIHVQHVDGPGCFGHNGADDAALDAALMAMKLPGRPVSLKWTREDENGWEPYGPATLIKLQASVDGDGNLIDWNHDVWGYSHSSRTRVGGKSSSLQPAWYLENAFKPPVLHPMRGIQSGVHRNAEPLYTFPHKRIVKHFISDSPLRVSAQRGLGAYANVFAMESFIDEVAHAVGQDPVTFRLRYMVDQRAIDVIQAVVNKAGKKPSKGGRGMAFAQYKNRQSYVAVVVDLDVNTESGNVKLNHGVIAVDAGQIVNPDGLSNQLEGAFTQSASWTLKEQVTFNQNGITSLNWRTYPILRFDEAPTIETVLINRPGYPYLGIGEGAMGPMAAAIANAIYDAAGIRLREIPFLPEKVKRGSEAHSTITD
jgi:nicotinate dehydrogenase subunit B